MAPRKMGDLWVDGTSGNLAAAFDLMVRAAAGNATKLAALARAAPSLGHGDRAYALACDARALAPGDPDIARTTQAAYAGGVPAWHFSIVVDERRNAAYEAALRRAVTPGCRVLDIGAGTGLLGMLAARAGAAEVVACEMNPAVADAAADIVAANGLADRMRVIARKSTDLDVAADLGGPVDVLVSEIVSNDVLGEAALPVMVDAVRRLLKPGGRMIPASATVLVALAELPRWDATLLGDVSGFDVSAFNRLRKSPEKVSSRDTDVRLRSAAVPLYDFDFTAGGGWPAPRAHAEVVASGGRANGVLLWMRLHLDDVTVYEVEIGSGQPATWAALFFPLDTPTDYAAGTAVRIDGAHDEHSIRLWVDQRDG
ncbi:MAG: 50S ribosomal protein L11 methyltransferase [Pseudomonadota bacterium]